MRAGKWRPAWMGKPYSIDLRERVQAEVEGGQSRRAAARRYNVSASFAVKLVDLVSRTGSAQPAPPGRTPGRGDSGPASDGSARVGRGRAGYHDAGTGGQIESREGCDGASGVVVAGAAEGGPVVQKKHCWPRRPGARTCARRVMSGKCIASRACARGFTGWSSSTKPARRPR